MYLKGLTLLQKNAHIDKDFQTIRNGTSYWYFVPFPANLETSIYDIKDQIIPQMTSLNDFIFFDQIFSMLNSPILILGESLVLLLPLSTRPTWNTDKPSAALDPYIPTWLTTSPANHRPANVWKSFFFKHWKEIVKSGAISAWTDENKF